MNSECVAPIPDEVLLDYWAGDLAPSDAERTESHFFACPDCARRLEATASLATRVAALARQGRVSGVVSRALLNRLQRDGVRVRMYSLAAGEVVPCAVFPDDDLVVVALLMAGAAAQSISISVTGPDGAPIEAERPVWPDSHGEVLWATSAARVRDMPSIRLSLRLVSGGAQGTVVGEYVLDHTAAPE
jgi:anti-sigma factor RsiW